MSIPDHLPAALETLSDDRLLVRARCGDRRAEETLLARHRPALVRHAGRSAQHTDAEDAVQDTLLAFLQSVAPIGQPSAWLYRVLANKLADQYRRDRPLLLDDLRDRAGIDDLFDIVVRRERSRIVREELAALSAAKRQTMTLRFLLDLDNAEIERLRGVTGIKQEVHRAKRELAPRLMDRLT